MLPILDSRTSEAGAAFERDLSAALPGRVRFDRLARTIYSTDASLYEIAPIGVAFPESARDVAALAQIAGRHALPVVPRGAGTGIAGGALGAGLQIDFSRYMTAISDLDTQARTVRVQPGVVLDDLNAFLRPRGLHFPPDVATSSRATLGGMIANNSCGARSIRYGRTVDWVESLAVVLADGSTNSWTHRDYDELPTVAGHRVQRPQIRPAPSSTSHAGSQPDTPIPPALGRTLESVRRRLFAEVIQRYPRVLRRNGGYALDRFCLSEGLNPATLVIGSEGTLGLVVEATLRLAPIPVATVMEVIMFDSVLDALSSVVPILEHEPSAVELVDHHILSAGAAEMPPALREPFMSRVMPAMLIVEIQGDSAAQTQIRAQRLHAALARGNVGVERRLIVDPKIQGVVWEMRKRGFGLLMSRPGERQPHEFIEDAAVDPRDLRAYIEALAGVLDDENVADTCYYAHASVGVIHVRPSLCLSDAADVQRLERIAERTAALVARFGGAFTGEHGDGLVRSWALERMYGREITGAFGEIKRAFDPRGILNPGKIVDPQPVTANLRYRRRPSEESKTILDFSAHGGMLGMAEMCSGVGQCRQKLVNVMCPSYMATLDEHHTTRARALALRAALRGDRLLKGVTDPALAEAMELCLSCKAQLRSCTTGTRSPKRTEQDLLAKTSDFVSPLIGLSPKARFRVR